MELREIPFLGDEPQQNVPAPNHRRTFMVDDEVFVAWELNVGFVDRSMDEKVSVFIPGTELEIQPLVFNDDRFEALTDTDVDDIDTVEKRDRYKNELLRSVKGDTLRLVTLAMDTGNHEYYYYFLLWTTPSEHDKLVTVKKRLPKDVRYTGLSEFDTVALKLKYDEWTSRVQAPCDALFFAERAVYIGSSPELEYSLSDFLNARESDVFDGGDLPQFRFRDRVWRRRGDELDGPATQRLRGEAKLIASMKFDDRMKLLS